MLYRPFVIGKKAMEGTSRSTRRPSRDWAPRLAPTATATSTSTSTQTTVTATSEPSAPHPSPPNSYVCIASDRKPGSTLSILSTLSFHSSRCASVRVSSRFSSTSLFAVGSSPSPCFLTGSSPWCRSGGTKSPDECITSTTFFNDSPASFYAPNISTTYLPHGHDTHDTIDERSEW